jgi:hypothetical protein
MATNELAPVTVENLLQIIGDQTVTIQRQASLIQQQAKELEEREGTQEAEVVK